MKRSVQILVIFFLITSACNDTLAGTGVKMKSGEFFLNIDSLKISNASISFYHVNTGKTINLYKRQLEYISYDNGFFIRYKSYVQNSSPGTVNLNTVNFLNGSFVSGTVSAITQDSIYMTVLNDSTESVFSTRAISFINYGNSNIEEFDNAKNTNVSQPIVPETVFAKKSFGESDSENYFGVKAGYVSSWMNSNYGTNNRSKDGFMLGASYYNRFAGKAAIDLTLAYVQKGTIATTYDNYPNPVKEYQFNFNYIEFQGNYQLLAPFKKCNLYFEVGLFMAEMISASGINKSADPDSSFKISLGAGQTDFHRFDLGLSLGTGVNFKVNDALVCIGLRLSDGWVVTGSTFDYNYNDLNYLRTQNYFSVYAVYGFRMKNKTLNK